MSNKLMGQMHVCLHPPAATSFCLMLKELFSGYSFAIWYGKLCIAEEFSIHFEGSISYAIIYLL